MCVYASVCLYVCVCVVYVFVRVCMCVRMNLKHSHGRKDFEDAATAIGRTIISERNLPAERKSIPPLAKGELGVGASLIRHTHIHRCTLLY